MHDASHSPGKDSALGHVQAKQGENCVAPSVDQIGRSPIQSIYQL
jgi:hypothetical protein